jgi:hypothetical protein
VQRRTERCLPGCKDLFLWTMEHQLRTAISLQKACFKSAQVEG